MDAREKHALYSNLRENIVEHVFIGQLLQRLWQLGIVDAEILKSEFDAGGYDLVLSCRSVNRHIQLKVGRVDGTTAEVKVSTKLAGRASGCVVWILVDDDLCFKGFRWFGAAPGESLPDISAFPVAKHTKGTAEGVKNQRPDHRVVKRTKFESLSNLDHLLARLLGKDIMNSPNPHIYISAAHLADYLYDGDGLPA
ncbi:hypothetical protein [Asticcacaulis biprosthecium]|uniref:hypothetical protein n=1 Tax=Asticcacaulis biprosthecium TaxID=76891 RepID=UPI00067FE28C|nr:hypothetical protein [Asticcacaulis biprosthecium]